MLQPAMSLLATVSDPVTTQSAANKFLVKVILSLYFKLKCKITRIRTAFFWCSLGM
jgi:hypothetical protein